MKKMCDRCRKRVAVDTLGWTGQTDPAVGTFEVHRPHGTVVTVEALCAEHTKGMRQYGYRLEPVR